MTVGEYGLVRPLSASKCKVIKNNSAAADSDTKCTHTDSSRRYEQNEQRTGLRTYAGTFIYRTVLRKEIVIKRLQNYIIFRKLTSYSVY